MKKLEDLKSKKFEISDADQRQINGGYGPVRTYADRSTSSCNDGVMDDCESVTVDMCYTI